MHFERITPAHRLDEFTCGKKSLDDWLKNHAYENDGRNLSRTFLLIDDGNAIVGYHSLTMGGVAPDELPLEFDESSPHYERGMALIGRLAVDSQRQRQGFGRDLLVDAVERAVVAGNQVAAQFIAVDPIDEDARRFYAHFGFHDVEGDVGGRMFMRLDEAIEALSG